MLLRALLAASWLVVGAPLVAAQAVPPAAPVPAPKPVAKKPKPKAKPPAPPPRTVADTIQATAPTSSSALVSAIAPAPDQARGIDAEVRASLFDLVSDRPLTALSRLEWLASSNLTGRGTPAMERGTREDLLFLLAESYYRLGLSAAFQATADQLLALAPTGRYVALVQQQLMLDAYRRGDYTTARTLANKSAEAPDAALAQFIAGLSAYQVGAFRAAHESFTKVIVGANPAYAPYARYMDALCAAAGQPQGAAAALDTLQPVALTASGLFGDQVKLAAAQLAFQAGKFDTAEQYAALVSPDGGLGADALLARAWSLYRAGLFDSSAALFGEYALKWPLLPGRDEARLMHGQILLEQHHAVDAEPYFATTSDSLGAEIAAIQKNLNSAMALAAQTLVAARAAGAIFVREAETGKSMMLPPDAGAEGSLLVAAFAGQPDPYLADTVAPALLSVGDLQARLTAVSANLAPDITRRVFYAAASSPTAYRQYLASDQSLLAADLAAAVAQYRLRLALADRALRVSSLKNIQLLVVEGTANLNEMNRQIAATQDSLDVMSKRLVTARQMLRDAMNRQTDHTTERAVANLAKLDSVRKSLGSSADSADKVALATEIETAQIYKDLSAKIRKGADSAIKLHPVFGLRDSIAVRLVRARALSAQGQQILLANASLVTMELARMEAAESDPTRAARLELAQSQQGRQSAELRMVAFVDQELRARAAQMVEALGKSREAADYGSASAAFFVAIEAKAAETAAGSGAAPAPER